ncbi:unnamed protein product, partial [Brassica rapa]
PWLSISTHISTLVLGLSTLALPVDCLGDFGPRGLSVQYTQDVRGCPPAHTRRQWLSVSTHRTSVAVRVCPTSVCVRQHTQVVRGCPSVHISARCTHRTSAAVRQHTQDVCGCPCVSVCVRQHTRDVRGFHTGRLWVSTSTHRTSVAVRVTNMTSMAVRVCRCVSVCVRQHTQGIRGCSCTLALPWTVWLIFGLRGLSVQYTRDVCGCPPAHTGRTWLSVCVRVTSVAVPVCPSVSVSTHSTSVAVHQYTYQHVGPWTQHAGPSRELFGTHRTSVGVHQHTHDIRGCSWLSVSTNMTSMAVRVCRCVSVCVRQHTQDIRRPWLSISTHISTLVLGLSTLTLPVDCLGDFGPPHTGRPCVSVSTHRMSVAVRHTQDVRGCPCVSVSTHRTSMAVHQYTYQHAGPWTQHAGPSPCWPFPWTVWVILAHVGCLFSTHRTSVGVRQHTQDVHVCQLAHTGCPWLSVCVCVSP